MHISYRWLARHVDLTDITPQQLVAELTLSTAEVEGLEPFLPHMADVTVGYVVKRDKHPDADKLSVCMVDVGQQGLLQIVCGANNVAAGQKVAIATAGTVLPGDFKIKKSKIRGQESNGMICSERELALGDEHDGIWVLPADAKIGARVADVMEFGDWVFEIDNKSITHRPDLWGHRGMAAEVAAIFGRQLKPLDLPPIATGAGFPVRIESSACSRYFALSLDNVQPQKSPLWLKKLLLAVGQRPIDLLVDISNFVMLDLGQPNHAFDRTRLSPEGIVVRNARAGEKLTTLDGVERKLEPSDLLICSGDAPVALAGIMGGEGSKVAAGTSSLLLEVATFHPGTVRRTSSRLGLRTDSLARFEKSLDPNLPKNAAAHFVHLLQREQPEVRIAGPATDAGDWKDPSRTIELRGARVRRLLGAELDDASIAALLMRLGFVVDIGADAMRVRVPSHRATKDITIEQDLIEEVGRLHRYGNIPERPLEGVIVPPPHDEVWKRRKLVRALEDRLALAAHFHQQISYSFVADAMLAKLGSSDEPHVAVVNPVAEGFSRVRRSVVPSLLGLLEHNRRQRGEVRLFEVGKGYVPRDGGEPHEVHELAIVLCLPKKSAPKFDETALAQVRGVVDDAIRSLGLEAVAWSKCESGAPSWAHPGRALNAAWDAASAPLVAAALEPGLLRALGLTGELDSDVAVAAIPIDTLLAAPRRKSLYVPLPQFPGVKVDVALALPTDKTAGEAQAAIERSGKGQVASIELFDVYSGPNLGPGKKSLAWHVVLQASDRTLTDDDVAKFLARVERAAGELGGELRRG
jgi:phenylalanyl-tRNA synthetase beta chain